MCFAYAQCFLPCFAYAQLTLLSPNHNIYQQKPDQHYALLGTQMTTNGAMGAMAVVAAAMVTVAAVVATAPARSIQTITKPLANNRNTNGQPFGKPSEKIVKQKKQQLASTWQLTNCVSWNTCACAVLTRFFRAAYANLI